MPTTFRFSITLACAVLMSVATTGPARAVPLADVFNTGVDSAGMRLADGVLDPHYTLVARPGGSVGSQSMATFPAGHTSGDGSGPQPGGGAWLSEGAGVGWTSTVPNSQVVVPGTPATRGEVGGLFVFETTFNLTGFDPLSAVLQGSWSGDDTGQMLLNGNVVDTLSAPPSANAGKFLESFSSQPGFFVSGINTLRFEITNSGPVGNRNQTNPMGLFVQFDSATADRVQVATPEPATVVLMAIGLLGARITRRRVAARIAAS